MAREFGLGATLFGAGVVAGSLGLRAGPVEPHLTTYAAQVGMSATMSGGGPVEALDPLMLVAVLLSALVVAVLLIVAWPGGRYPRDGGGSGDPTG